MIKLLNNNLINLLLLRLRVSHLRQWRGGGRDSVNPAVWLLGLGVPVAAVVGVSVVVVRVCVVVVRACCPPRSHGGTRPPSSLVSRPFLICNSRSGRVLRQQQ